MFNEVSTVYSDNIKLKEDTICIRANEIMGVLVGILSDAAVYSYGENIKSCTKTVVCFLKFVRSIKPRNMNSIHPSFLCPWSMIEDLTPKLIVLAGDFAFSQLLALDGASEIGPENRTLLHLVSDFWDYKNDYNEEALELIISLMEIIIRHGCPVEARDDSGNTANLRN